MKKLLYAIAAIGMVLIAFIVWCFYTFIGKDLFEDFDDPPYSKK